MSKPLEKIRVIELTQNICGPFCTQILGDLGAEIIKIEPPEGDVSRWFGIRDGDISTSYLSVNRGKKSVVLNIDSETDVITLRRLLRSADVIVEDLGPGRSDALQIGYEEIKKDNPDILYLSINGYGYDEIFSDYSDQDAIVQALSGFMSITGESKESYTKAGAPVADVYTGLYGAITVLAGIIYRGRKRKGMYMEVSKLNVMLTMMPDSMAKYLNTGMIARPKGIKHQMVGFFDALETKDGSVICMACQDFQFKALAEVLGIEGIENDERFDDRTKRCINSFELEPILSEKSKQMTMDELTEALLQRNLPVGSIAPLEKVLDSELVEYHELLINVEDSTHKKYKVVGSPIKFEKIESKKTGFVSGLGEYTEEILKALDEEMNLKDENSAIISEEGDSGDKPLSGIRVLDLTRFMAGPLGTQILGELGAEVIKVERGDRLTDLTADTEPTRDTSPAFGLTSTYYMALNIGKKDIVLDYKNPEHLEIFYKLTEKADIVSDNFRPGVAEKLHIAYEDVKKRNPDVIYSNVSGFGYTGPYRNKGCVDTIAQAMSGFMHITGKEDGAPVRGGSSIADVCVSLYETVGILAGLIHRDKTGEGQFVEVPMISAMLTVSDGGTAEYLNYGRLIRRCGNRDRLRAFCQTVPASNGEVMVEAASNEHFEAFVHMLGLEERLMNDRFNTSEKRLQHLKELEEMISMKTRCMTKNELMEACHRAGVPAGQVNTQEEICRTGYLERQHLTTWVRDSKEGIFRVLGLPVRFSSFQIPEMNFVPQPGEHTIEVLYQLLGMSEEEVKCLFMNH